MTHLPYDIDDPALVRATWSRLALPRCWWTGSGRVPH